MSNANTQPSRLNQKSIIWIVVLALGPISLRRLIISFVPAEYKQFFDLGLLILMYAVLFGIIMYTKVKKKEAGYFYPFVVTSLVMLLLLLFLD